MSERTWQAGDRTLWRAKNTDTFKPMGPWIETDVDLDSLQTTVRINGEIMSQFATNSMIFGVAHYISEMSKYLTLHPGDMIWMGTDGATQNMKAGDTVDVEISGIGTLSNPVFRGEELGDGSYELGMSPAVDGAVWGCAVGRLLASDRVNHHRAMLPQQTTEPSDLNPQA